MRGIVVDHAGKTLFVVDAKDGKVDVLDIATDKIKAQIPVGLSPEGIGSSTRGDVLATCLEDDNAVTLIDAGTLKVSARSSMSPTAARTASA